MSRGGSEGPGGWAGWGMGHRAFPLEGVLVIAPPRALFCPPGYGSLLLAPSRGHSYSVVAGQGWPEASCDAPFTGPWKGFGSRSV